MGIFKNIFNTPKKSSNTLLAISNLLNYRELSNNIILDSYGAVLLRPSKINSSNNPNDLIKQYMSNCTLSGLLELKFIEDAHDINWIILKTETSSQLISSIDVVSNYVSTLDMGNLMIGAVFLATYVKSKSYIICNYRTSKFYPFIPVSQKSRNNDLELTLGSLLEQYGIPVEDTENWYALWDSPI